MIFRIVSTFFVVMALFGSFQARAELHSEFNGFYSSDNFTTAGSAVETKMFYGLDIYANINNKNTTFMGFHVDQWNLTETADSTITSLKSLNLGPMFLWVIDRQKVYSLTFGYLLQAKGTYTAAGSDSELSGNGLFASFGFMPEFRENLFIGLKLNYYSLNYNRSIVASTTSDIAYTRSFLFPTFSIAWRK